MVRTSIVLIVMAFITGCNATVNNQLVVSEVPSNAIVSAQKAVDFMQIESVELVDDGLYKIKGMDVGVRYEVAVRDTGEIVNIAQIPTMVDKSEATFSE